MTIFTCGVVFAACLALKARGSSRARPRPESLDAQGWSPAGWRRAAHRWAWRPAATLERLGAIRGGTVLASWRPSASGTAVLARLHETGVAAITPSRPPQIDNLGDVDFVVQVLAGVLALLAAASLLHVVVSTVRRQRHDLAVLRVLGFGSGQMRSTRSQPASVVRTE